MTTCVALLRGINVGGHRKVPMADLRATMDGAGLTDVETYIQSGNVVFDTSVDDVGQLEAQIGEALQTGFGFEVPTLVRSAEVFARTVDEHPFGDRDEAHRAVAFLAAVPDDDPPLSADDVAPEEFALLGGGLHIHCPNGFGRAKLTNTYIEKQLRVAATTRNWRTVVRLASMSDR